MVKDVVFIGNRVNALREVSRFPELNLAKAFVLEGSPLHHRLDDAALPPGNPVDVFGMGDKKRLLAEIRSGEFDVLLSNGCPFIIPVGELKKDHQTFVNIHPTLLPRLKGKTPLNGVFFSGSRSIGATMHHMDDGIDTGRIIAQEKVRLTRDIDQGLVYAISFSLEAAVFCRGMEKLIRSGFTYRGRKQRGEGSYFNRTPDLQKVDAALDDTNTILTAVKSFGIKSQGTFLSAAAGRFIVYSAEEIVNPFLHSRYMDKPPGEVVLEYDGKLILRSRDGLIKLTDFVAGESAGPSR
jgi:methionyl-tRNA formyltransferase